MFQTSSGGDEGGRGTASPDGAEQEGEGPGDRRLSAQGKGEREIHTLGPTVKEVYGKEVKSGGEMVGYRHDSVLWLIKTSDATPLRPEQSG